MSTITFDQMVDFSYATFEAILKRKPAHTFVYENYDFHNDFFASAVKQKGGDRLEGRINLADEGNAKHSGIWDDDTHNIVNISRRYEIPWVHSTTNFSFNLIEQDLNSGAEQIFDTVDNKYDNMCREWVDEVLEKIWITPASSSDTLTPHGVSAWLRLGTDDSTGGWTGYSAVYGDGNTYNLGGIASSATSNDRWASYYADHNGNLDDSLLVLLDRAHRKLRFRGPSVPKPLDLQTKGYKPKFAMYSNDSVIGTINQLYAKSDDQMGRHISQHYGVPHFKNVPILYVPILDTADTNRYGTDPIFGINHQMIFPVVQPNWNWKIGKPVNRAPAGQHLINTVYGDLEYAVFGVNPRHAGFLISQQ
jgi:hypothetical protein